MKTLSKKISVITLQKLEFEMMSKKVYLKSQKFKYLEFVSELNQTYPRATPELTLLLNLVASKAFELFIVSGTADPQ